MYASYAVNCFYVLGNCYIDGSVSYFAVPVQSADYTHTHTYTHALTYTYNWGLILTLYDSPNVLTVIMVMADHNSTHRRFKK